METEPQKRRKILMVLSRIPYPAVDGTRYKLLHNVASGLRREFDVELLLVTMEQVTPAQITYLRSHVGPVHVIRFPKWVFFTWRALRGIFSRRPFQAEAYFDARAARWIRDHALDYDGFYVHTIRLARYFEPLDEAVRRRVLLDFNDAISLNYRDSERHMSLPKRCFFRLEGRRVERYESRIARSFFRFNAVSERDRDVILKNAGLRLADTDFSVTGHGMVMSARRVSLAETRHRIFFVGQLDYAPNRDSVEFFIRTILPSLVARIPSVQFIVIGRGKLARRRGSVPHVTFTGFVPDVFAEIADCSLLVSPTRFGAGTPSKIIEAMAYGMPVLTTPTGAAGISGVRDGENILIVPESDTQGWISAIERVLSDAGLRERLGGYARALMQEKYSSDAAEEGFRRIFRRIVGEAS